MTVVAYVNGVLYADKRMIALHPTHVTSSIGNKIYVSECQRFAFVLSGPEPNAKELAAIFEAFRALTLSAMLKGRGEEGAKAVMSDMTECFTNILKVMGDKRIGIFSTKTRTFVLNGGDGPEVVERGDYAALGSHAVSFITLMGSGMKVPKIFETLSTITHLVTKEFDSLDTRKLKDIARAPEMLSLMEEIEETTNKKENHDS
jgi:hypothetical protein